MILDTWLKLPKHHYYKFDEWKKPIDCRDGRTRMFYISKHGDAYNLIGNEYIYKEVSLEVIENYINNL
jgi:hypothetical protein